METPTQERTEKEQQGNGNGVTLPKNPIAPQGQFAMSPRGFDPRNIEEAYWYARRLANTKLVPERWQGQVDDCFIAIDMALRLRVHPIAFLQGSYVVYGQPGMEAKLVITLLNQSGLFTDPLDYEVVGKDPSKDDYAVRAFATRKSTSKVLYGPWITWKVVRGEEWDKKKGSKWLTIPELMFTYRAAAWFASMHCPEIKMGMLTTDELEDLGERHAVASHEVKLGAAAVLEKLSGTPAETPEEPPITAPAPEPTVEPEKLGAYTCQDCGQTFDNPVPCHKGKNKGKSHCPDLECGSFNIIRTELLGIPEPDPSITEPDVEPEPSDPTTAEPAEPATGPAGDAIESPPAGSPPPPTDDPMFQCLNKGHKFPLSQAKPSAGTQWGLCPVCLTKKIQPLGG